MVIEHLLEMEDSRVAYIYCDYKDQAAQTASNIVGCLARQLIEDAKPLPQRLMAVHEECKHKKRRPRFDESKTLLEDLCSHEQATYIVVDALDKCRREQFLPVLQCLAVSGTKIFVTSRPNNEDIL